jgi:DNA-binding YbaB/EbfC family protein
MKPGNLIKTLTSAQLAMQKVQAELNKTEFSGTSGGGLVKVTITGEGKGVSAEIDPAVLKEDTDTVAALFLAALNVAAEQKEKVAKEKLKGATSKLLPAGITIPGLF